MLCNHFAQFLSNCRGGAQAGAFDADGFKCVIRRAVNRADNEIIGSGMRANAGKGRNNRSGRDLGPGQTAFVQNEIKPLPCGTGVCPVFYVLSGWAKQRVSVGSGRNQNAFTHLSGYLEHSAGERTFHRGIKQIVFAAPWNDRQRFVGNLVVN